VLRLATIGSTGDTCPHYMSRLRRVNCCLPLWFYKALPAKPCQTFFKGIGGTWATAHSILFTYCVFVHFGLGKSVWSRASKLPWLERPPWQPWPPPLSGQDMEHRSKKMDASININKNQYRMFLIS
jgi:hypothetical protein